MGYSDAAPYGAGRVFTNADLLTPQGLHGAVGAQNLEPWSDLSSQGSVEMTLVVTSRPRQMPTPPIPTAQPWAHECWTAGAAQKGIGLRAIIFAPLDGAKFMSPRFYRGKTAPWGIQVDAVGDDAMWLSARYYAISGISVLCFVFGFPSPHKSVNIPEK